MSNKDILLQLRCTFCPLYVLPPIGMCAGGHVFCSNCFKYLVTCATCGKRKSLQRCLSLENIHSLVTIPCRFYQSCSFKTKGSLIGIHEKNCSYSTAQCPLKISDNCDKYLLKCDLLEHCKKHHFSNSYFSPEEVLKTATFINLEDKSYYVVFFVFDNIFRFTCELLKDTGRVTFAVYQLGNTQSTEEFFYEIFLLKNGEENICLKAPIVYLEDESKAYNHPDFLFVHHDMIKQSCDELGELTYKVRIRRNNSKLEDADLRED